MFNFTIKSYNKSIYFIELTQYAMVWGLLEFYTRCYKLKNFYIVFCLINYYIIKIITRTIFNISFFQFIFTFHLYFIQTFIQENLWIIFLTFKKNSLNNYCSGRSFYPFYLEVTQHLN